MKRATLVVKLTVAGPDCLCVLGKGLAAAAAACAVSPPVCEAHTPHARRVTGRQHDTRAEEGGA